MSSLPVFTAGAKFQDLYDMNQFSGRLAYFAQLGHPRNLRLSHHDLVHARRVAADRTAPNQELWEASRILSACQGRILRSGELETNPWYLRLSGWPVVGTVPVAGLAYTALWHPRNVAMYAFFHWVNQTQISVMTYLNSNSTGKESPQLLLAGYSAAMLTAMGVVLASRAAMNRSALVMRFARFAPLPAAAAANTANILCTRGGELGCGVPVFSSEDPKVQVGTSRIAAAHAIGQTTLTRWVLPCGNFLVAPLIVMGLSATPVMKRIPRLPMQVGVSFVVMACTLPVCFALFPKEVQLRVEQLEEEFHHKLPPGSFVQVSRGL